MIVRPIKLKNINIFKILFLIETIALILMSTFLVQDKTLKQETGIEVKQAELDIKIAKPNLNDQKALIRILDLQEIKDFKKLIDQNGKSNIGIQITEYPLEQNPFYTVKVYESFPDHTTTFGWYRYDQNTEEISKQDTSDGKWTAIEAKKVEPLASPSPVIVYKTVTEPCPITNEQYTSEINKKNTEIAQLQEAVAYLKLETQRLQASLFYWQSLANSLRF